MRASSSGCILARAVVRSRDRGCKGHRILRRAPSDGRHPGSHDSSSFTRRRARRSRRLPPRPKARAKARPGGRQERRGDRDVRGSITIVAVGTKRPRSLRTGRCVTRLRVDCRSAEAVFERRETLGPPVKPRRAQTLRGVHAAKAATANRERARCGYTQVVRVAEVDRTHRASCSPGDRKVSWWHAGR